MKERVGFSFTFSDAGTIFVAWFFVNMVVSLAWGAVAGFQVSHMYGASVLSLLAAIGLWRLSLRRRG